MSSYPKGNHRYRPGVHRVIDDINGFDVYRDQVRMRWDNKLVRHKDWNVRHPQDFLRSRVDRQVVDVTRQEQEDVFSPGPSGDALPWMHE